MKTTWIVQVKMPGKVAFWFGPFLADGREIAKVNARRFVAAHLPLDCEVISIAPGSVKITFDGPEISMEES